MVVAWDAVRANGDVFDASEQNEEINQIKQRQKYHGFLNRTDSILAWTDSTPDRTLTITGTYVYYYQGTANAISTSKAVQITNTVGLWWIYFNTAGTLTASQTPPAHPTNVVVCCVYWNGTHGFIREERHGYNRNLDWAYWAHNTIGCRYGSGLLIGITGVGATAAFTLNSGSIYDEDINFTIPASSAYVPTANAGRIKYQIGATAFTFDTAVSLIPFKWNSGTSRVQFPDSTNAYALTDLATNKYVNIWVYATPDLNVLSSGNGTCATFIMETIAGNVGYTSAALARAAPVQDVSASGLSPEIKIIYRLVVDGSGQIVTPIASDDLRNVSYGVAGGTSNVSAAAVTFAPTGTISATNVQGALAEVDTEKIAKTANITALNETGIADGEICVFNPTNKDIRTSDKTIVTTLGSDDTTVPTSKAVKDYIGVWATFPATPTWPGTTPTISSTVARYVRNGNLVSFAVSYIISEGNAAALPTIALPVPAPQIANYQVPLTAFKKYVTGGSSSMSDPFAFIDFTLATPVIKFNQPGILPSGSTAVLNISGSYEVA
jgi:hypothetical protein